MDKNDCFVAPLIVFLLPISFIPLNFRSVLEILLKWLSERNQDEKTPELKLEHLEHAFPYSIAPFSEQLTSLRSICPKVTTINIVTEDFVLPHLIGEFTLN